jgi:oligopeptide/dipeptide ABC transporter ATP-binding protein
MSGSQRTEPPLLEVSNLTLTFQTVEGTLLALDDVQLQIERREILGLVGETGCGKTVTALTILRIIPENGEVVRGQVLLHGTNLLQVNEEELRRIRGEKVSIVFQDPAASLNPVFTIRAQMKNMITSHKGEVEDFEQRATNLLRDVGFIHPDRILNSYPHELSGGMQQRVALAISLSCSPELIIADEPTTALDVVTQAQILKVLKHIRDKTGASILLVSHNLGVIAKTCDRVAVMYAGNIVEVAPTAELFNNPKHHYTLGLLNALPRKAARGSKLQTITGSIPSLINPPSGCKFHPRCPFATEICIKERPGLELTRPRHLVACHHPAGEQE